MDVTSQISKLIEEVQTLPNSLARNKVVSALQNARVWSTELPLKESDSKPDSQCICSEIGIRKDCPVHGKLTP